MAINVIRELYAKAPDKFTNEGRSQTYLHAAGLKRVEHRSIAREADWSNGDFERFSDDNGRTWGEWTDVYSKGYELKGEDEINTGYGTEIWNPVYGHYVSTGYQRIFLGGHQKAYENYWKYGKDAFVDHILIVVRKEGCEEYSPDLVKYEDGADYNPEDWRNPEYLNNNRGIYGYPGPDILENGDIIFPIEASILSCCRILGLDINELFPSCPDIMNGLIIVRGKFNKETGKYDLSFSRPIVISDLKSSRAVNEPTAIMLPSGRILAVFRGSNVESKNWNTRIEPGTPCHKWYCYSDDGARTFTEPVPWHFDDREVFYSSATCSTLVRSIKNGKVYWIGNISGHTTCGNYPRHPLVIAEVNDRGLLIKDTLTTIDRREERDSDLIQLSNFSILQDRETKVMELYLVKHGQRDDFPWQGDCYRYFIEVE